MVKKICIVIMIVIITQLKCIAQDINIAFTIDKNYHIFTQIVIFSILENNLSNNHYNFYIVEDNMTKRQKLEMQKFVKERKQDISFIHVDTDKIDNGSNVYKNNYINGRISRIGMARLLLPEILPNSVHKVIYLDSDIIVSDDIAKLYNINLENNPIGMVIDINSVRFYKKPDYYNSGVIIMDVDMWRKEQITEKILKYFHENIDLFIGDSPCYSAPDQDLLNILLKKRITKLPLRWNNLMTNPEGVTFYSTKGINHYLGPIKPWYFVKETKNAYNLYYEYWDKSPLKKYKLYCYLKYHYMYILKDMYKKIYSNLLYYRKSLLNVRFTKRVVLDVI